MAYGKIIVLVVFALIAGGLSYQIAVHQNVKKLHEKNEELVNLLDSIEIVKNIPSPTTTPVKKPPTSTPKKPSLPKVSGPGELDCLLCHELEQTKTFHFPQTIMKIDERDDKRRRVCVDCHGPNGYDEAGNFTGWSPDKQMTDLELIGFDDSEGINGKFILPNKVVHSIHKRKLDIGILTCQFCHVPPGETAFVKPRVKTELGRVLYCQNEGCHDNEGGNYIAIHIELRPFKCTTCHNGQLSDVHKGETEKLGKV